MVEMKYIKIFHVPRQRVRQEPGTGHAPSAQHAHFTEVTPADRITSCREFFPPAPPAPPLRLHFLPDALLKSYR